MERQRSSRRTRDQTARQPALTKLIWDNQNRGIDQSGLERRLDQIADKVLEADGHQYKTTRRKPRSVKSRRMPNALFLSASGVVHVGRSGRTLCGYVIGSGWTQTSSGATCVKCLKVSSTKNIEMSPTGDRLDQSPTERNRRRQKVRNNTSGYVGPTKTTTKAAKSTAPRSSLPPYGRSARQIPKTLDWGKLKVGNVIHETDCSIAWLVRALDSGAVSVKRTKQSRHPGPDTAMLSRSALSTMHRFEDCTSTHRQRKLSKLERRSERKPLKVVQKPTTRTAKVGKKRRGWRNPPRQA
jgi:hypothetical protein